MQSRSFQEISFHDSQLNWHLVRTISPIFSPWLHTDLKRSLVNVVSNPTSLQGFRWVLQWIQFGMNWSPDTDLPLLQKSALRGSIQAFAVPRWLPADPWLARRRWLPQMSHKLPPLGQRVFAPKLDQSKNQFIEREVFSLVYRSELVNYETLPSKRLLSLVCHQMYSVSNGTGVPWKYRLTASKADELAHQRQAKLPKFGIGQFAQFIGWWTPPQLISAMALWASIAFAICWLCMIWRWPCVGGAHLANLKAYSHKFVGFLTQRIDAE